MSTQPAIPITIHLVPHLEMTHGQIIDLATMMYELARDPSTRADLAEIVNRKFPERAQLAFWDVFNRKVA